MSQCTRVGDSFSPWPTIIREVIKNEERGGITTPSPPSPGENNERK